MINLLRKLRDAIRPPAEPQGRTEPWRPYEGEPHDSARDRHPPMDWDKIAHSQGKARAIAIDARWQIERGRVMDLAEFAALHGFDPKEIIEGVSEDILSETYDRGYADGREKGRRDARKELVEGLLGKELRNGFL